MLSYGFSFCQISHRPSEPRAKVCSEGRGLGRRVRRWLSVGVCPILALVLSATLVAAAPAERPSLAPFLGWWSGEGRLGFRDGQVETVRCRATYRNDKTPDTVLQAVRCASQSGDVDVRSQLRIEGDRLSGTWEERRYGHAGTITGQAIPDGFRVEVVGAGVRANMAVLIRQGRQIVEIQFHDSTLIGLTMVFDRGGDRR